MSKDNKLEKCQLILNKLEAVIENIKEGNVIGSFGRKIIDLGTHNRNIPGGLHLDDYFIQTFSSLAYFLIHYKILDESETGVIKKMLAQLHENAAALRTILFEQQGRFREYVPRPQEFTARMDEVWAPKFEAMVFFLQQFTNLRHGDRTEMYLMDRKTLITEAIVSSNLKDYDLL